MKQESLPSVKSIYQSLEQAAVDAFGFAVICQGGASWMAESVVLDSLLLALENFWFVEDDSGRLSHREYREELFKTVWEKAGSKPSSVKIGTDVPLGHEEMSFYQLPLLPRAVLFLRTKKRFSYSSIALVLGITEGMARIEAERAREFLLGRRLKPLEWTEEDF